MGDKVHEGDDLHSAIDSLYRKVKSGNATKGEVFRMLTTLSGSADCGSSGMETRLPGGGGKDSMMPDDDGKTGDVSDRIVVIEPGAEDMGKPLVDPVGDVSTDERDGAHLLDERKDVAGSNLSSNPRPLTVDEFIARSARLDHRKEVTKKSWDPSDAYRRDVSPPRAPREMAIDPAVARSDIIHSGKKRFRQKHLSSDVRECTFRPKINEMSSSSATVQSYQKIDFNDRVLMWKDQKAKALQMRQEEKAFSQLDDCSFRPKINERSKDFVEMHERYDRMSFSERLYRSNAEAKLEKVRKEQKRREEEEFQKHCTFKPNLRVNRTKQTAISSTRATSARLSRRSSQMRSIARKEAMRDCTFRPKINPLRSNMESASLYLKESCFERLSRPRARVATAAVTDDDNDAHEYAAAGSAGKKSDDLLTPGDGTAMNTSLFLGTLADRASSRSRRERRQQQKRANADDSSKKKKGTRGGTEKRKSSPASTEHRRRAIQTFLNRQKQQLIVRKKRIDDKLKFEAQTLYRPKICKKSRKICKERGRNFLKRVEQQLVHRKISLRRLKKEIREDPKQKCSFRPKITSMASKKQARSAEDLSRGDAHRKEINHRVMKMKADQDALADLSFCPESFTNPKLAPNVDGRLKVLTAPDTYVRRMKRQAKLFSERQRQVAQEEELKLFSECTFHPDVHEAPKYVKRIAKSMKVLKAARGDADEEPSRPKWV